MPSESGDRKLTKQPGAPPPEPEHLPCPRCDSTNTKFCYYNNYNFSQPRHFCKACRRYWTHGGTLRDIPVGGGTRKSAKRIRSSPAAPLPHPSVVPSPALHLGEGYVAAQPCGSFTSLLGTYGPGFNGFGGFGFGDGPGFEDMGFGLRRPVWPFGDGGTLTGNTWQMQSGESGFMGGPGGGGGECFTLPELAISTPGNCLK